MGIFTGGKSRAINSPRHLTLRHARRTVYKAKKANGLTLIGEDDDGPDLLPGEERLNSFWAPSLVAGPLYEITAEQTVTAPTSDDPLLLVSKQPFTVDAPQFSLPENSVYSIYPPSGYPAENRILPHIVLSDPHLPWERIGSPSTEHTADKRNRVPWLVLFSFTQDELKLEQGALKGFADFKQTATLSIKMTVGEMRAITNAANPVTNEDFPNVNDKVGEFIFMKPDLFKSLFSTFGKDSKRVEKSTPDTQQYKYLSHVRKINTTGMAIAGVEDVGIFSVVVSNRAGPLHNKAPATVVVHLLSIEGVEKMAFPGADKDYVSLCSLHSWNYTGMPPNMLNVYDTFVALGASLSVLRPPQQLIDNLKGGDRVPDRLAKRLEDGYSLVKYRLQTGEPTMAFYRGPFTPTVVPRNSYFDTCSNSGQDFQILDQELGIIDITYSSAWNVGRVLAAGDQSFTAALTRFRGDIHAAAMKMCKLTVVMDTGRRTSFRTREDVLGDLKNMVKKLNSIHQPHLRDGDEGDDQGPGSGPAPENRWFRPLLGKKKYPMLNLDHELINDKYQACAIAAALELSLAKDNTVYDETNNPVSTDWMVILAWVMDRMFLSGVPAHYLISDPLHLTPESLKFFYIDPNWIDAMIDGALSLGNEKGTDMDRTAIKSAINRFVEFLPPNQKHRPQIPTYGFYLRSDLVTMFPDLKVETLPPHEGERPEKAPLLRHEIVADGVMIGLFDRVPGSDDFKGLTFTQPPHQQCFAAGDKLAADHITINMRKQYTVTKEERKLDLSKPKNRFGPPINPIEKKPTDSDNYFLWNTVPKSAVAVGSVEEDDEDDEPVVEDDLRIIRAPYFAQQQLDICKANMGTWNDGKGEHKFFDDDTANSALFAMQLTDPIYYLEIDLQEAGSNAPVSALASLQVVTPITAVAATSISEAVAEELPQLKLRTLHSINHSVVPKLFPSTRTEDDEPDVQQRFARTASDMGNVLSTTRSFQPSPLTHVPSDAPHVRPIQTTEAVQHEVGSSLARQLARPPDAVFADGDPAGPPVFKCQVFSPQADAVLLDKDGLRQDLVFSVLVGNQESNYMLKEFDIAVPLGDINYRGINMLMETYDGPGATMLSNLRFNVLMQFTKLDHPNVDCLMIRIVPRNSSGYVSVKKVFEMGFLLSLAKLNQYKSAQRVVTLYTREYYKDVHETDPIPRSFNLVLENNNVG